MSRLLMSHSGTHAAHSSGSDQPHKASECVHMDNSTLVTCDSGLGLLACCCTLLIIATYL